MHRLTPYLALLASSTLVLAAPAVDEPKAVVAVYDLEGPISESGEVERGFGDFSFSGGNPLTLLDLTRSLAKAATDPEVKAVVLDADQVSADLSQIQEIRQQLLAIRAAGKDVWLYSEHLSNRTALLGSAANHFTLMPEADCNFSGIHAESIYFKGMLDRLGIEANVIHIGDFKSFGENFYRTGPSDYALKQEEKLIDSIYQQIVNQVASGRKLKPEQVQAIIDDGAITPQRALTATLVDHLMYRTDFVKKLRTTYGEPAEFDRSYELPDRDGPEINGIMDVLKLIFKDSNKGKYSDDFVASSRSFNQGEFAGAVSVEGAWRPPERVGQYLLPMNRGDRISTSRDTRRLAVYL